MNVVLAALLVLLLFTPVFTSPALFLGVGPWRTTESDCGIVALGTLLTAVLNSRRTLLSFTSTRSNIAPLAHVDFGLGDPVRHRACSVARAPRVPAVRRSSRGESSLRLVWASDEDEGSRRAAPGGSSGSEDGAS